MEPTHPHGQGENATAPSAGGFPDGEGEGRMEKAAALSDSLWLLRQRPGLQ